MRLEIVGGSRKGFTVSFLRHLCLGEENNMRFSRGYIVVYRLKVRSKTTNVAEINEENIEAISRHLRSIPEEHSDPRAFMAPSQEGTSEIGVGIVMFYFECYKGFVTYQVHLVLCGEGKLFSKVGCDSPLEL